VPLVLRPPYGSNGGPISESKLPSGPPAGRGVSLDSDISGTSTYTKPVDDIREFDKSEEGSIYRQESPDTLAKPQAPSSDQRQIILQPLPGPRPKEDSSLTKYPYRDGIPNAHNASVVFVLESWKLRMAHELYIPAEDAVKVAAKLSEMLDGLNPKLKERAASCTATLKRADIGNLRWIFSVDCGNGPKSVHLKASRKGNTTRVTKMDLLVSCSCPAWQWLGPEHHAMQGGYLERGPKGTASVPFIRDPQNHNLVCKHVAAALGIAERWEVPKGKGR